MVDVLLMRPLRLWSWGNVHVWGRKWEIFILCTGSCKGIFWFTVCNFNIVILQSIHSYPHGRIQACIHIHMVFVSLFFSLLHCYDSTVTPITSGELLRAKSAVNEWIIKSTVSPPPSFWATCKAVSQGHIYTECHTVRRSPSKQLESKLWMAVSVRYDAIN